VGEHIQPWKRVNKEIIMKNEVGHVSTLLSSPVILSSDDGMKLDAK
jgi:hypothetical protein